MKDKKGYLAAHVACSRHCSPEKLQMLLSVNPDSLFAITDDGQSLLSLAMSTATKSHPNYALIDDLHQRYTAAAAEKLEYAVRSKSIVATSTIGTANEEKVTTRKQQTAPTSGSNRKRKVTADDDQHEENNHNGVDYAAVELLMHFSCHQEKKSKQSC